MESNKMIIIRICFQTFLLDARHSLTLHHNGGLGYIDPWSEIISNIIDILYRSGIPILIQYVFYCVAFKLVVMAIPPSGILYQIDVI